MGRLRLGYMVPEFPGQTHIFFWREIEALRRRGADVRIVSTKRPFTLNSKHGFVEVGLSETHYLYPPRLSRLTTSEARMRGQLREALRYILALQEKGSFVRCCGLLIAAIDLVAWARENNIEHIHGHSCANTAHVLALANRIGGIPYSLTLHGDLDIYGSDHPLKMKNAKFVCAVGQHLVRQIVERVGLPHDRVFSTLMGLDTASLAVSADSRNYNTKQLRVITVARLNQTKGHLYAIDAISKARASGVDLHYTIVGEGPQRDTISSRIKELNLTGHVTMTGSLPESEVFRQLSQADLFILPSFGSGEAWPVSVMEAMAVALPVISTRIGATEEMIAHERDGVLVEQRDSEGLFFAIKKLAQDSTMRERIGKAARATAMRRFDVAISSGMLLNAIWG
jgi:colanic acid/amylovoran biosynthesis glycosyltransferase